MSPVRARRRPPCRPHLYVADMELPADALGRRPCWCGLAQANQVHQLVLAGRDDEERAYEARRTGEEP